MELKQQVSDLARDLEEQILIEQMSQSFNVKPDVIYRERDWNSTLVNLKRS